MRLAILGGTAGPAGTTRRFAVSAQRFALTGLLIIALLASGMSLAEPASKADSASSAPQNSDFPPPDWTYGPAVGTLAAAGDLNGDGYGDAILVDPQASAWTRAVARVFYGSPTGLGSAPNWVLTDHWQTCAAGDVNGDGFDDLFAGSLQGLQVFYGSHAGPTPGTPWRGPSVSLSSAGDVNGDGFDDLLVGDPFYTNGQEYEGRMVLYYGSPVGPSSTPPWTLQGDASARGLGSDVLSVGDINGDGYDDVGSHNATDLSIYVGSPTGPASTAQRTYPSRREVAIAAAGDVDGDGFDDLILGDPTVPCGPNACGAYGEATLYRGSASGLGADAAWTYYSDHYASLGQTVAGAGDVNGDGYADVSVGAPNFFGTAGAVFAFLGSPNGLASEPHWIAQQSADRAGFGDQLGYAGDANGDGYDDLLAGHSAYSAVCSGCGLVRGFYGTAAGLRDSRVLAPRTNQPPTIDGNLGDWTPATGFALTSGSAETIGGQTPQPSDASVSLRSTWTATDLYLALHITDDLVVNDSAQVWNDDEIELAFYAVYDGNPAGGDTHQYTINADGRITDLGQANPPIQAAAVTVPGGWNVEVRIPAAHLFGFYNLLTAGTSLTFNLGLHDDDDGGAWDSYLIWQGTSTVGGEGFGSMVLIAGSGQELDSDAQPTSSIAQGIPEAGSDQPAADPAVLPKAGAGSASLVEQNPTPDWSASTALYAKTAGDVNGDGYDDVITTYGGQWIWSAARLYLGSHAGLGATESWFIERPTGLQRVAGVGDVNGDGFDDIFGLGAGVFLGSPAGPGAVANWSGPNNTVTSPAGDVNGDGYDDLLMGEVSYTNGQRYEGRVMIFFGSAAGLEATPGWIVESNTPYHRLGDTVIDAGDVNGDGYDDVGAAFIEGSDYTPAGTVLFHGSAAGPALAANWTSPMPVTRMIVAGAGDVNGDGFDDLLFGDPYFGSANTLSLIHISEPTRPY